ncbi:MAG: glutamine-hydrolyzing carbamoyl-phosphate synthase small subunit [Gammaproteobacteria bacterium]
MDRSAILALSDGSVFYGTAIGAEGVSSGEVVFNTAMTGYQEIITDPSYAKQIVTLTYPHIGSVGINDLDDESRLGFLAGLVIRNSSPCSNWRATQRLSDFLRDRGVIAIADIDTRRLTRILRHKGSLSGCIHAGQNFSADSAISNAKKFSGLENLDLAKEVTCTGPYKWAGGVWSAATNEFDANGRSKYQVVAIDFGIKRNILRLLSDRGCEVEVVPASTKAGDILDKSPDGVFLSNGPGDPKACDYAVDEVAKIANSGIPIFGICLGYQILALAFGARTMKMKFGHHGANHPVKDLISKRVMITSQNHGFAVDESNVGDDLVVTHKSLFDGTIQGIKHRKLPAFGFQGHPEGSPGPHDIHALFDKFETLMNEAP